MPDEHAVDREHGEWLAQRLIAGRAEDGLAKLIAEGPSSDAPSDLAGLSDNERAVIEAMRAARAGDSSAT